MTKTDSSAARKAMIDSQLRTSGVNEPFVIARMGSVAREEFVPDGAKAIDRFIARVSDPHRQSLLGVSIGPT